MKVLSFDIGIRNLAYCIMDDTDTLCIKELNCCSILQTDEPICQESKKSGEVCGKKCSTKWGDKFSCKTHFPKELKYTKKKNFYSSKKCKEFTLHELAKMMIEKLNILLYSESFEGIDKVLIELQPSFSVKMKFLSHILYCKVTERYIDAGTKINFIRATEKLKVYKGRPEFPMKGKNKYANRKKLAIIHAKLLLKELFDESQALIWQNSLEGDKADDKSDAFLYCLCCLKI